MTQATKLVWWLIVHGFLAVCTYFGVHSDAPRWLLPCLWWAMATVALMGALDWDSRLDVAREGRAVGWIFDYLFGLVMILFLLQHGWHFTALAVVVMMIFEELIFSTDPTEWEISDTDDNGNT